MGKVNSWQGIVDDVRTEIESNKDVYIPDLSSSKI